MHGNQGCESVLVSMRTDTDPETNNLGQCGSGSWVLMTKNYKVIQLKNLLFLIENCISLSLGLHDGRPL
jgi:hypothetical protein